VEASETGSKNRLFQNIEIAPIAYHVIDTAESEKESGSKRKHKKGVCSPKYILLTKGAALGL